MPIAEMKKAFFEGVQNPGKALVAGRVIGLLEGGFVLQDESGRADIFFERVLNAGDIVEAEVRPEKRVNAQGEEVAAVRAKSVNTLAPCVTDFFIRNSDANYKKMIADRSCFEKLSARTRVVKSIRNFFDVAGFLEVETPQMVGLPGMEPHLTPFKTQLIDQAGKQTDMYMITSPEYAMKKILVSGAEKIFQICRSFRNRETDSELHNPEFTLLEWYRAYASYEEIMKDTEDLVEYAVRAENGKAEINFKGNIVDVAAPWERKKVKDLFEEYAGIEREDFENIEKLRAAVKKKGYAADEKTPYEDLFYMVFLNEIEPKLGFGKPIFVCDYPVRMAALSKKCEGDGRYAERFEAYVAGVEICNGFTELNDPAEQKERLSAEREQRLRAGMDDYAVDQSFITALEFGMPPSGGNALGVDRLAMLVTGTADIREMMFFPLRDLSR